MGKKRYRSPEEFERHLEQVGDQIISAYVNDKRTMLSIGQEFELSHSVVGRFLRHRGIYIRTRKEGLDIHYDNSGHRIYKNCEWCNKEFCVRRYYNETADGRGRFCSIDCHHKYQKRTILNFICEQCGEEFQLCAGRLNGGQAGRFCSRECFHQHQHDHVDMGDFVCVNCSKEFRIKNERRQGDRQYCCRACFYEHNRGENCPLWGGAPPDIQDRIRHSSKYYKWKSRARARDNYTCQDCLTQFDKYSIELHVHHIRRFIDILAEFLKICPFEDTHYWKRKSYQYAPLWDLNNAVCLCLDCHARAHSKNPLQEQEKN